jgi:hypothetical protein|tara:strand:+ start:388 stop:705 length:318 start_codon:yes stop_codon:yes gene_type:complete
MQVTTSGTVFQTASYNHSSCNTYITGAKCFLKGEREITSDPFPVWSLNPSLPSLLEQRERNIIKALTKPKRTSSRKGTKNLKTQICDASPGELDDILKTMGFLSK